MITNDIEFEKMLEQASSIDLHEQSSFFRSLMTLVGNRLDEPSRSDEDKDRIRKARDRLTAQRDRQAQGVSFLGSTTAGL